MGASWACSVACSVPVAVPALSRLLSANKGNKQPTPGQTTCYRLASRCGLVHRMIPWLARHHQAAQQQTTSAGGISDCSRRRWQKQGGSVAILTLQSSVVTSLPLSSLFLKWVSTRGCVAAAVRSQILAVESPDLAWHGTTNTRTLGYIHAATNTTTINHSP